MKDYLSFFERFREINSNFEYEVRDWSFVQFSKLREHIEDEELIAYSSLLYATNLLSQIIYTYFPNIDTNYSEERRSIFPKICGILSTAYSHVCPSVPSMAFPQFSRQIMMSKLKRSHANAMNQMCRGVKLGGFKNHSSKNFFASFKIFKASSSLPSLKRRSPSSRMALAFSSSAPVLVVLPKALSTYFISQGTGPGQWANAKECMDKTKINHNCFIISSLNQS